MCAAARTLRFGLWRGRLRRPCTQETQGDPAQPAPLRWAASTALVSSWRSQLFSPLLRPLLAMTVHLLTRISSPPNHCHLNTPPPAAIATWRAGAGSRGRGCELEAVWSASPGPRPRAASAGQQGHVRPQLPQHCAVQLGIKPGVEWGGRSGGGRPLNTGAAAHVPGPHREANANDSQPHSSHTEGGHSYITSSTELINIIT